MSNDGETAGPVEQAVLPPVRLLRRKDVRECVTPEQVVDSVRVALIFLAQGKAMTPAPLSLDLRAQHGEVHVKGAHIEGNPDWTVKLATGFYDNPARGLPTASGLSLVASSDTGLLDAIVLDGGLLTDLRTGAAGCLAADALAPEQVEQVAMIGCGIQARIQLEFLLVQRRPSRVLVFGRDSERAKQYAQEMSGRFELDVEVAGSVSEAVRDSQLVITVTPSEGPLVEAEWLGTSVAVVAVGSDMPGKQELEPAILERAGQLVADDPQQAGRVGELQHAPSCIERAKSLGSLLADPGGRRADGISVADLTGLGVEDAAVAGLVAQRAWDLDLGELLRLS